MLIKPAPIYVEDILATATADAPVSVDREPGRNAARPVGHGWLRGEVVQPGLAIGAADYAVFEDYAVRSKIKPGFYLFVSLGAPVAGDANNVHFELPTHNVGLLNVRDAVDVSNLRVAATHQLRCGLSIDEEWFDSGRLEDLELSSAQMRGLRASHMKPLQAAATSSILTAARGLTASMNAIGPLGRLRREISSLQLIAETIALLVIDHENKNQGLGRPELSRLADVRQMLDELGPLDEILLAELAQSANMSVRSLGRHFRSAFGTSIFDYVANARMDNARRALERGDATIDQAAYIAGFSHTTNFFRAFKRRYGRTPAQIQHPQRRGRRG